MNHETEGRMAFPLLGHYLNARPIKAIGDLIPCPAGAMAKKRDQVIPFDRLAAGYFPSVSPAFSSPETLDMASMIKPKLLKSKF